MNGTGNLTLGGANTYTGATNLTGGTLVLGNPAALQDSTLDIEGGNLSFGSLTAATFGGLTDVLTILYLENQAGTAPVTLTVGNDNITSTYDGILADGTTPGGALVKVGTGSFTLSETNTYTGGTTLDAGTLYVDNTLALGTGTLSLGGGTLDVDGLAGSPLSNNIDVTANVILGNSTDSNAIILNGILTNIGNNIVTFNNIHGTTFSGPAFYLSDGSGCYTLTLATGSVGNNVMISAPIGNDLSHVTNSSLAITGNGQVTLTGANSYSGNTTIGTGATLIVGNSSALGASTLYLGNGTVAGDGLDGGTGYQLYNNVVLAATNGTIGGPSNLTFGGLTNNATNILNLNGNTTFTGTVDLNTGTTAAHTLTLLIANGDTVTISGSIIDSANTGSLTLDNAANVGTLILSGANTYNGTTILGAGTLDITGSGTLGNTTVAKLTVHGNSTLDLGGTPQTVGNVSIGNATSTGTIQNGTLTSLNAAFIGNNGTEEANAVLNGTLGLTKNDATNLTLDGANTYGGNTTLNTGTLILGNVGALGTSTLVQWRHARGGCSCGNHPHQFDQHHREFDLGRQHGRSCPQPRGYCDQRGQQHADIQ